MRLIEPLGLLEGEAARQAIGEGRALRLAGGGAFTLARLIDGDSRRLVAATDLPADWHDLATRLGTTPPDWAGFGAVPVVMGIVNVTPDSFSDGGDRFDPGRACAAGREMVEAGAGILDIGGESTRPGSAPVSPEQEQARILPVIRGLRDLGVPISVDTRHASTMAAALDAGAAIINDVSALAHDPRALAVVAGHGAPVVLMHMRGTPDTMASLAQYQDVAVTVTRELAARVAAAEAAGIPRARIVLDPGIGFAKDLGHNLETLRRLPLLLNLGCRLLVGVSRKSFIGGVVGGIPPKQRDPGSLAAALFALARGASILRVHDVAATVQAVRVWQALSTGLPPH
ncbi:Dihydropteroate synthase [Rhodovastum atsumiense]|uniref:Dihydropteroate synthase n=1 Tax=Rhodovastum atsumiense TaxID=504468 RepID=A0A5M6IQH7_9PROT|nr:dihydropteroate synthase [Rhodovastum atsumiense]KAA5610524.1 dihydropteroate synthase [Rhodovastum atsumiense]CAH2605031.1 Dihydropteroate synthase [Rhodovastum atsumiense]